MLICIIYLWKSTYFKSFDVEPKSLTLTCRCSRTPGLPVTSYRRKNSLVGSEPKTWITNVVDDGVFEGQKCQRPCMCDIRCWITSVIYQHNIGAYSILSRPNETITWWLFSRMKTFSSEIHNFFFINDIL